MICKRCQRSLRSGEGLKCGICESCFHMRCVADSGKEQRDGGDRGYQWKCSLCQNYVSSLHSSASESSKDKDNSNLMQTVSAISEKIELVNKIQLPKLNSDLAHIKSVAERIAQQNEDILRKIGEIGEKRKEDKPSLVTTPSRFRKRNVHLSPKLGNMSETNNEVPVSVTEKSVRYRTRRRSYLLHRIFRVLNKKMNKANTPR